MKPIIVDMKDMSDSTEVYESRPNPFIVYFIYLLVAILVVTLVWMKFSKIDIVVKSNGIFRGNESIYDISSLVTGRVSECNVRDGQYVNEGDRLYVVDVEALGDTIFYYQAELNKVDERIAILEAYQKYLDGDKASFESLKENSYYHEFVDRKALLDANIDNNITDNDTEIKNSQSNVDSLTSLIMQNEAKKNEFKKVKECIAARVNSFDGTNSYYESIVNSYISNYEVAATPYDKQIAEYEELLEEYRIIIGNAGDESVDETVSSGDMVMDAEEIQKKIDELMENIEVVKLEKQNVLSALELQHITSMEQQIESIDSTIMSLQTSLNTANLQLDTLKDSENSNVKTVYELTEKGNIANEILTCQSKKEEYEKYLNDYNVQNGNCIIKASTSGYFYLKQDIKTGTYIQEGSIIGKIYPENQSDFYAEIYVENSDIAKLTIGQEVKFEIAAYPSSEYGYFTGRISKMAQDISVEQSSKSAYYLVEVACDNITLKNKEGKEANLINGMACQAKIVVDEENVLTYLLRKINLVD